MPYRYCLDMTTMALSAWQPGQSQQIGKVRLCKHTFQHTLDRRDPHQTSLPSADDLCLSAFLRHPGGAAVYRLLTSAFVHGGLLHVAFNMLAFVPISTSLERIQGTLALTHLVTLLIVGGGSAYVSFATVASYIPWR